MCAFAAPAPLRASAAPRARSPRAARCHSRRTSVVRTRCSSCAQPRACSQPAAPRVDRSARDAIKLMACDMDGTILDSSSSISAANVAAVNKLLERTPVLFVPATGKSRIGALRSMKQLGQSLRDKYPNGCPGVYLQGLLVFNTDGELVYENKCDAPLARTVTAMANDLRVPLIAYSRDQILCERKHHYMDLLPTYHEPAATQIGDWESAFDTRPLNKFIFMAEPHLIDQLRPIVAEKVAHMANLTQAQSNMLEVLPPNSSKGDGVRRLLDNLGVQPESVLAIGDAENDLELLKMVRYSCAVGNALPSVKEAAVFNDLPTNDQHAVAHAIERFFFDDLTQ